MGIFTAIGTGAGAIFGGPAGAGIGATIGSSLDNMQSTRDTNKRNQEIAREQMNFQERMSNTAHQREVKDLQKAGLNPILSAGGGGASTPSGASATMVAPQLDMPGVISTYGTLAQIAQNQQRVDNETKKVEAEIPKKKAETDLAKAKKDVTGKGAIRAELEKKIAEWLKEQVRRKPLKPKSLQQTIDESPHSSGGELLP